MLRKLWWISNYDCVCCLSSRRAAPRLDRATPFLHLVHEAEIMNLLITAVFCVSISVLATADYGSYTKQKVGTPLPMGSARPLYVDTGMDCDIKELAWEYAKKLLPQVSHAIVTHD